MDEVYTTEDKENMAKRPACETEIFSSKGGASE